MLASVREASAQQLRQEEKQEELERLEEEVAMHSREFLLL